MAGLVKQKVYDWKTTNVELIGGKEDRAVRKKSATTEPAWDGIEDFMVKQLEKQRIEDPQALKIWRIEKFEVKDWPPPKEAKKYGEFYKGDSYIILHAEYKKDDGQDNFFKDKNKVREIDYDVHFWIGTNSTQDEYGTAAYKTVELDTYLDDKAVQHREVQGCESDEFKEYFTNYGGIKYVDGGIESGFKHVDMTATRETVVVGHYRLADNKKEPPVEKYFPYEKKNLRYDDGILVIFSYGGYYKLKGKNVPLAYNEEKINPLIEKYKRENFPKAFDVHSFDSQEELEQSPIYKNAMEYITKLVRVIGTDKKEPGFKVEGEYKDIEDFKADHTTKLDSEDVFIVETFRRLYVWVGKDASSTEKHHAMHYAHKYLEGKGQDTERIGITCYQEGVGKLPPFMETMDKKGGKRRERGKGRSQNHRK